MRKETGRASFSEIFLIDNTYSSHKELTGGPGGEGGIRTPDTLSGMPVFKTGAINHSATSPRGVRLQFTSSVSGDDDLQTAPSTLR